MTSNPFPPPTPTPPLLQPLLRPYQALLQEIVLLLDIEDLDDERSTLKLGAIPKTYQSVPAGPLWDWVVDGYKVRR